MTKKFLADYRSKKAEIEELQNYLLNMNGNSAFISKPDTILDYHSGYPVPQAIVGIDWKKVDRTEKRYQKRIEELEKECEEVEQFIENITDSLTRRIFRMYFTEGMRMKDISKVVHIESSGVSKRIRRFLDKHLTW